MIDWWEGLKLDTWYKLTWNSEDFIRFCNIVSLSIVTFIYLFLYHNLPDVYSFVAWGVERLDLSIYWQWEFRRLSKYKLTDENCEDFSKNKLTEFIEKSEDLIRFFVTLSLSYQFYIHLLISIPNLQWYVFIWGWDGILKEWNSEGLSEFDRQWQMSEWQIWQFAMILSHFVTLSLENGSWEVIYNIN